MNHNIFFKWHSYTAAKKNEAFCRHCYGSLQDILSEKAKHRAVCIAPTVLVAICTHVPILYIVLCGDTSGRTQKKLVHGALRGRNFNWPVDK